MVWQNPADGLPTFDFSHLSGEDMTALANTMATFAEAGKYNWACAWLVSQLAEVATARDKGLGATFEGIPCKKWRPRQIGELAALTHALAYTHSPMSEATGEFIDCLASHLMVNLIAGMEKLDRFETESN